MRTCDGRYFPVTGLGQCEPRGSPATVFARRAKPRCFPAAISTTRPPTTESPIRICRTRFAIRNELVSGCTCNGKDQIGLAPVKIENDPTLRKGDIVAGDNGLLVAGRSADKRGAELNFSPASEKVSAKYTRLPVVARE